MKTGVSSYSFDKYIRQTGCDYLKICDIAAELGFEGIEFINLDSELWHITDNPLECAEKIRRYCNKIGLDIIAYTVGADFSCCDKNDEVKRLCRCIDVAAALGAPVLRHDICYSLPKIPGYTYREAVHDFAPFIREVSEYAARFGIKTCSENHGFVFQRPERVEQMIREVSCENYGWLCDMGNFLCADADPAESVTVAAPYTFHAHAKDFLFKSGELEKPAGFFETVEGNYLRGTIIGHGVVPVSQCIKILKKSGYDGYVSVEFEGMEEPLEAIRMGLEYIKSRI